MFNTLFLLFLAFSIFFTPIQGTPGIRSIVDEPTCSEVKTICNNLSENDDILILECLQSLHPSRLQSLNNDCQNVIWRHTSNLTSDEGSRAFLGKYCSQLALQPLQCNGDFLKCVVSNKDKITEMGCLNVIARLENVAFQDYKWIGGFLKTCNHDIERLSCGRIDGPSWDQFQTVTCLQNKILNVQDDCKREVFKLSELQAENIKLDRQLYLACAEDYLRYCQQFPAGSGRVFSCLVEQPQEKLTSECHKQLMKRERLIAQDFKVSKGLMRACRDDIKKTHCKRQTSSDKTVRLAQILLCLENIAKNGTLKIDPDCEVELIEHRRMLMEDYSLSPEIVEGCSEEIRDYCVGFEGGGKTIHCLMDHARFKNVKKRLRDPCMRALEALIKETDAGEDWRVDPVLHQACYPVVRSVCRDVKGGDARVMSCLLDNIGADHMTEECEDALVQIQYFVARDFKLDPKLYRTCRDDAARLCHADQNWVEGPGPSYEPQVLPCLYRHAYLEDTTLKLKNNCLQQIQRVMRQRAISVDLQPEIEEVCLDDLAEFCYDKTKKGEETYCLQSHLDDLKERCRQAIESFTELEGRKAELNPYIMQNCRKEMEALCSDELKKDDGDVMECLISHKNDPMVKGNPACRISIEHFQIISLKDYRFTYKFKVSCKNFAMRFCNKVRSKNEVVTCLSEKVTNDTVNGVKSVISKECRQQLKAQLLQQRENVNFDPKLKNACSADIKKFCSNVEEGGAQVLECLQSLGTGKLSDKCEQEVFEVKRQEFFDNSIDHALQSMCADAIFQFCPHHEKETILDCLKINKDQKGFGKKCRSVVVHRLIEQNSNYQLNPSLQENCKLDMKKFCMDTINANYGKDLKGEVIKCLKKTFKKGGLSHRCEIEMVSILREQALDVSLNPLLRAVCKYELETICKAGEGDDGGKVEECLKDALLQKNIHTPACQVEVGSMIEESEVDIQVDPLLQEACALDLLKFCKDVPQGNGRHVKCLKVAMADGDLSSDCKNMLNKRLRMFESAALVEPPRDIYQLYRQVEISPAKHHFFFIFIMMISSVFVVGIIFGRIFKRQMILKNK